MKNFLRRAISRIRFGKVTRRIIAVIEDTPCEIAYYDRKGRIIGYWAYGCFDPNGLYRGEQE